MNTFQDAQRPSSVTPAERRRQLLRAGLIGLVAVLLNIGLFVILRTDDGRAWLAILGNYASVGVFFVTLVANATVIVPVPYPAVIASVASQSDNLALVIAAGALGSVLGESVAFFVGRSGRGVVEDTRFYRWVQIQMRHPWRAFMLLFLLSAPPNPAFDVAGLAAGALGLPYWLFFTAVFLGRMIRIGLFVLVGVQFG
ncbi:MAG TPA: VTT domain-containing protein [Roseiflexaceae bacterium]|nr:VTT domain-containing protein [Roseiflexaceae bacterium]